MYDVAIIGGGPAGATAGYFLAKEGCRTVILEREKFPRFHIGESLLPRTLGIYDRLGIRQELESFGFIQKYGAQFVSNDGAVERQFDFFNGPPNPHNVAWEVERDAFDHLLLKNAARGGAEVREETSVLSAETHDDRPCTLKVRNKQGAESTVEARWIIDASGQSSLLAKKHDLRVGHPTHKKVAFFSRYRGAARRDGRQAGNIDLVLGRGGWFWVIPLRNDQTSLGFVSSTQAWKESGLSGEAYLARAMEDSGYVTGRFRGAERCEEVYTASNYSYSSRRMSGPGFVLIGDAAEFLDPIFSTGVMLAVRTGEIVAGELARRIKSGGPLRASMFERYEKTFRRWTRIHFKMIEYFYSDGFASVFLNPKNTFGLQDAVTALLAGQSDMGLMDRLRLQIFYGIVRLNRAVGWLKDPRSPEAAVPHG